MLYGRVDIMATFNKKILIDEITEELRILAEEKKRITRLIEKTRFYDYGKAQEASDDVMGAFADIIQHLSALRSSL